MDDDKDITKILYIEQILKTMKMKYDFIKKIQYISDTGFIGLKIYHPRMVYLFHSSQLKEFITGFYWEGEYKFFFEDMNTIDKLKSSYNNIEMILPIRPGVAYIKYTGKDYVMTCSLYNYKHRTFIRTPLLDKIKYLIYKYLARYLCCCVRRKYQSLQ